jgi:hypothetical protein
MYYFQAVKLTLKLEEDIKPSFYKKFMDSKFLRISRVISGLFFIIFLFFLNKTDSKLSRSDLVLFFIDELTIENSIKFFFLILFLCYLLFIWSIIFFDLFILNFYYILRLPKLLKLFSQEERAFFYKKPELIYKASLPIFEIISASTPHLRGLCVTSLKIGCKLLVGTILGVSTGPAFDSTANSLGFKKTFAHIYLPLYWFIPLGQDPKNITQFMLMESENLQFYSGDRWFQRFLRWNQEKTVERLTHFQNLKDSYESFIEAEKKKIIPRIDWQQREKEDKI